MPHRTARLAAVALATCLALAAGTAHAGDCQQVTFKFINHHTSKIKVKSVGIVGNEGQWNENVGNKQVDAGQSHTTGKQRLNKLDSGKKGDFTVFYELWDANNARWNNKAKPFNDRLCNDGKQFVFDLS